MKESVLSGRRKLEHSVNEEVRKREQNINKYIKRSEVRRISIKDGLSRY